MAKIEKREESSYRLTVSCGYDKQGKQITKRKTVDLSHIKPNKQEEEAQRQWILFKDEIEKGTFLDAGKITFEDFIQKWLKDYAEPELAPKTFFEYKGLLNRIITALGHIKLNKLQPTHLTEFYNNLREDGIRADGKSGGLSEKTILHYHRLISCILNWALQWGFILNNPALRVKPPKVPKKEARHYDIEETMYILNLLEYEPLKYKTMITLAIYGGMREGELDALTWSDIDFNNCTININKSLQHIKDEGTFVKSTKNENTRKISLPQSLMTLLKEYKVWQNGEKKKLDNLWIESDRLFTQWNGDFIFPSTVSKWFLKFIRKHNASIMNDEAIQQKEKEKYLLREVNFHGLRHTSATLLINQNTDISTVSKRLGHARTSTTMDIYSHALQKADKSAADKLDNLFNKNVQNKSEEK